MKESTEVIDFDMDKAEGLTGKDGHPDDMPGEKLRVEQKEPADNSLMINRNEADAATKSIVKPTQIECIDVDTVQGETAAVAANAQSQQKQPNQIDPPISNQANLAENFKSPDQGQHQDKKSDDAANTEIG